jgi:hypothetical protein
MARDDAALSAFSLRSSAVAIGVRRWRVADRSVANETFDTGGHIVPREHARIMIIVAAEVRGVQSSQEHQKTSISSNGLRNSAMHDSNNRGKTHKSHNHRSRGDTPRKAQTIQFSNTLKQLH